MNNSETFEKEQITKPHYSHFIEPMENLLPIAQNKSFASVASKVLEGLQHMGNADNHIIQMLNNNICDLQNTFIEIFYELTLQYQLDISSKITLRLDKNFRLFPVGNHPQEKTIILALNKKTELSAIFAEIASQSSMLRNIQNLCTILEQTKHIEELDNRPLPPAELKYQVSIKGEMNHFYFNQTA